MEFPNTGNSSIKTSQKSTFQSSFTEEEFLADRSKRCVKLHYHKQSPRFQLKTIAYSHNKSAYIEPSPEPFTDSEIDSKPASGHYNDQKTDLGDFKQVVPQAPPPQSSQTLILTLA